MWRKPPPKTLDHCVIADLMAAHAKVVHSIHGRMRVKVPAAKRNPALLREIKRSLAGVHSIRDVNLQPATNGFTLQYSGQSPTSFYEKLAEHGRSSGLFDLAPIATNEIDQFAEDIQREAEILASHSELARSIVNVAKNLDTQLKKATNNNVDLKVLLPLGLAVYTFFEYGAEAATPLWVTLGIFSFTSFVALHPPVQGMADAPQKARPSGVTQVR